MSGAKMSESDVLTHIKIVEFLIKPLDSDYAELLSAIRPELTALWKPYMMRGIAEAREFLGAHSDEEAHDHLMDIAFKKEGEYPISGEFVMLLLRSSVLVHAELKRRGLK